MAKEDNVPPRPASPSAASLLKPAYAQPPSILGGALHERLDRRAGPFLLAKRKLFVAEIGN
jgi:hypothetical protein